jgi:hypothetical protein
VAVRDNAGDADEVRRANEHRLAALMAAIHNDDDVVV